MKTLTRSLAMVATAALVGGALPAKAETVLNVVTAGSENMVDYVTDYLGPMFEEQNPGVKVNAVGTQGNRTRKLCRIFLVEHVLDVLPPWFSGRMAAWSGFGRALVIWSTRVQAMPSGTISWRSC